MGRLIRFGGVGVVLAVFGMLAFLIFQVFPLFIGATVAPISALTVPATAMGFGEDEYGELPFVVLADGDPKQPVYRLVVKAPARAAD